VTGIAGNGCWLLAGQVERVEGYDDLLDDVLDVIGALLPRGEGPLERRHLNALLGSPGAVVPVHFDRHHNFLLQVAGTKRVTVAAHDDPLVVRELAHCFDADENPRTLPPPAETVELRPGDGLVLPPYTFHWVEGDADVSIAVSCEVRTETTLRTELVHECNARLRRLHLHPRPPGRSVRLDRAKAGAMRAWRRARRRVRQHTHR
jgi:hypothetical protein